MGSWVLVVALIAAGLGWLDLLRRGGVLDLGPGVPGALPLEQLATDDDQPLARLLVAWLPVGALAAVVLGAGSRVGPRRQLTGLVGLAAVVLAAAGAVSDAATISGPLSEHLLPQLWRAGTLVAVLLIAAGALLAGRWPSRAASRVPSGR